MAENKIHLWVTQEFAHYEKGPGWYLTFGIIAFLVVAYYIYLNDYFAAITIGFICAAVYFFSKLTPREVEVVITDKSIIAGGTAFPYSTIRSFWIVEHSEAKQLHLETTAYLNREIVLLLADQDPDQIAEILRQFLPEGQANRERISQKIARRLRF